MKIDYLTDDVLKICFDVYEDQRGSFFELFNNKRFISSKLKTNFVQDNISFSKKKNTIRGLHYQMKPYEQSKLLCLMAGSIIDVFIDARINSKNFGKSYSVHLKKMGEAIFIPKGFLHGFCTLEKNTLVGYKVDEYYNKESETGVIWNDNSLNINWPLLGKKPVLSEKDKILDSWDNFKIKL